MSPSALARLLAVLAVPAAAYVAPASGNRHSVPATGAWAQAQALGSAAAPEAEAEAASAGPLGVAAASVAVGAVLGWLSARRQQVASAAAATAVALAPAAAPAMVNYEGIKYLGGSDKVDINNANVQAYRQFPGMYPSAAGAIATHGPYKSVSEVYDIPNLDERVKAVIKKYEENLVCLPPSPAYFLDRINNFMYR
eukprot:CAMPEP_0204581816 /NCGR_PEP_ID=MMETSP0661-20131031/44861_1 /ASSEMBLY_ACC=CAM_ASM_000606 /TAXON_ID=109239 /ORGANISM="Alexandrium margalefi, Strain AMGDE01CS-322" /LENGTH=195 /DNA_ID=CAMNT_0051591041 /DNA_START=69 /DNA_END=656 /DNA_ORIENTATION=+